MNTRIFIAATFLFLFLVVPTKTDASTAIQLGEQSALFTIDFAITDSSSNVEVPLLVKAGVTYKDRVDEIGYTIQEGEDASTNSIKDLSAIVLSPDTELSGTRYKLQAGNTGLFTILIIATFSEPLSGDYRASVTKLPYWLDGRRTTVHENQINEIDRPVLEVE